VDITVIGSMNIDLVLDVKNMPKIGETIKGSDLSINTGGKGANQAIACALFGNSVSMIGRIGNDLYGKLIIENLKKQKINTSGIKIDKTKSTGSAIIMVDENGENCIVISSGANGNVSIDDIKDNEKTIADSKLTLLQFEIPTDTVIFAIEISNYYNVPVLLNPAPAEKIPIDIYKKIDILIPNEVEACTLTNIEINDKKSAIKAANILLELGVKNVILTLGKNGSMFVSKDKVIYKPSIKVNVIDTTAAGDAFIGGFAHSFIKGEKIDDALEFATFSAALAVTKKGAQSSFHTEGEVTKFRNLINEINL